MLALSLAPLQTLPQLQPPPMLVIVLPHANPPPKPLGDSGGLLQGGLCKGDGSEPGIVGAVPGPRVSTEQEVITPCTKAVFRHPVVLHRAPMTSRFPDSLPVKEASEGGEGASPAPLRSCTQRHSEKCVGQEGD